MSSSAPLRILQVSDTHLGEGDVQGARNWAVIAELAQALQPALVVHTGDLVLHDPDSAADRRTGLSALGALGLPWRITPGNHEVGDSPSQDPVFGQLITPERLGAWREDAGEDRWRVELGDWVVAGLNAMLFGTGWDEEEEQWAWLADLLTTAAPRPVVLFMHKPPYLEHFGEDRDDHMSIPAAARARLRALVAGSTLRLIACGHRHEFRSYAGPAGDPAVVWAPPVSFLISRATPPVHDPVNQPGCVLHTLLGDRVISQLLSPAGLERFDGSFLYRLRAQA
jgi:3',5'-cyclic AMP phosphodiesterase CpdA